MSGLSNTELAAQLSVALENLNGKLANLESEFESLNNLTTKQTRKTKARIKEIRKEALALDSQKKELEEDIKYLNELHADIDELEDALHSSSSHDKAAKMYVKDRLKARKEEEKAYIEALAEKYDGLLNEEEVEEKKGPIAFIKKHKKGTAICALALAVAIAGTVALKSWQDSRGPLSNNPDSSTSQPKDDDTKDNDQDTPANEAFTDINDEEKLLERVNNTIVPAFDSLAPQHGVDEAYAIDMFNYINGGSVEEVSREDALDVIKSAEVLMNNECLYAVDMRNKGESLREENTSTIDYGIFFLDGTRAQQLASKISDCRRRIIIAPNSEDAELAAKEFTELVMNSWYLQGSNGEINAYGLETSGQAALIDKLFLNTADLVQANMSEERVIVVINPLDGEELTLGFLIEAMNEANCPGELVADNGDIVPTYINKFSADMEGMVKEAAYNKQAASENFTYGLK